MAKLKSWEDPNSDAYARPYEDCTHCVGCGKPSRGCHWGPWCFDCNVARFRRIDASFARMERSWKKEKADA